MRKLAFDSISDPDSFVRFAWEEHHEVLAVYSRSNCRRYGFDASLAEDLMQDFYQRCITKFPLMYNGYRERGVGYFFTVLRNLLIEQGRKAKSMGRLIKTLEADLPKAGNLYHFCVRAHSDEFKEDLRKYLNEKDYQIMALYIDGYSYDEIGELLGMTGNNVGVRISRIKRRLAGIFNDKP